MKKHVREILEYPRVSIITPFLNNEAFLSEAIESVVAQTFENWEYLLVNDGSGHAATAIAKWYAEQLPGRIRYLEHPGRLNYGISATRNLGVKNVRGEFIAFLDLDDIWLPSKLADHVALLDAHQEVGMVCGTTIEWKSWSSGADRILRTGHRQDAVIYPPDAAIELYPLGNARAPSFSDVVFRAELVKRLGGFAEQFIKLYDDQVLLSKVYLTTPVYFCSITSNKYRQHPASTCATATKEQGLLSKLNFLEWLEQYLKTIDNVDPRVKSCLHRRLRAYRSPRIHYFLSVSAKTRVSIRAKLRIRARLRSAVRRIRPPKPKPLILLYHRITDEPIDPWGLTVSPGHFEEHLGVLRRTRQAFPLLEFVRGLQKGTLPPNAVAVTFDDGYVDNLVSGKPRLAAAGVPATVFLTTGYVNSSREFWWDELTRLLLLGKGPKNFELMVRGHPVHLDIGGDPPARQVANTPAANRRHAALISIWKVLRHLEDGERELAMRILRSNLAVTDHHGFPGRGMTTQEIHALVAGGLVTIGAHTVTHPALPSLETEACRREIAESKLACEALIGAPVSTFAYPYGDLDAKVRKEVISAKFTIACSTQRGPAIATSDGFALPRFYAPNAGGDEFEQALRLASAAD